MRLLGFSLYALSLSFVGIPTLSAQIVQVLETRADQSTLLAHRQAAFSTTLPDASRTKIVLDDTSQFQRMDGFGASLTDSTASLLMKLPQKQREDLMQEIFSPNGPLGLTLLRQPIGASDFSAHGDYSYDDPPDAKPDLALKYFGTATDGDALFPLLRQAMHLNPRLRIMILPWSAPAWMKDSKTMRAGALSDKYLPVYAQYLAHTVEAYGAEGLPIFAMALQNEPLNENPSYPTQHMDPVQEAKLGAELRPMLSQNGRNPLLMGYEHNWNNLEYPSKLLAEAAQRTPPNSAPIFAGISFHCYAGNESAQLAFLHDHLAAGIWFTECSGVNGSSFGTDLLWQAHHLLLGAPLNEARSVLLWNIALDPHGGPHNGGCGDCRALFTIDSHDGTSTIHRNVEYYELAHAAPFIHPGAVRIAANSTDKDLQTVAYRNGDGTLALLVLNSAPHDVPLVVQWHGQNVAYDAPPRALLTLAWGTPVFILEDGTFRIAAGATEDRFLEATPGATTPAARPLSTNKTENSRQLWKLHRLADGRFEVRNVATAQSLGLSASGKLMSPLLDGSHVASLSLRPQANGVCLTDSTGLKCAEAQDGMTEFRAGTLLHFLAP